MAKLIINTDISRGKINKNIYGHFSEHLGRCIYGGILDVETIWRSPTSTGCVWML